MSEEAPKQYQRAYLGRKSARGALCKICHHPERARIEADLMASVPYREIVGKYGGFTKDGLSRHFRGHVPDAVKIAAKTNYLKPAADANKLIIEEGTGLLENLRIIRGKLFEQFDAACQDGTASEVATLSSQLHRNLEMVGKSTGELATSVSRVQHQHIVFSPSYINLRTSILKALRKHPDALADVIEAFRNADNDAETMVTVNPKQIEARAVPDREDADE